MSESGAEYSWYELSDDQKDALLEFVAQNDLAESSFDGVAAQLQVFGQIGMSSTFYIINMDRNGLLDRPTTNKEMSDKKTSMYHDFPE